MITNSFERTGSIALKDDAPQTDYYFDMEQYQDATNQSDNADQVFPLDRWALLVVTTTFSESTTMQFDLVTDDAITFNTGPTRLHVGPAIGVADLVAGKVIWQINLAGQILDRYITFDNTKSGSAESTGRVELLLNVAPIIPLNTQKFTT